MTGNGARKTRLAVWKFASCDGCQLTLLDCEDELLSIAEAVDISYFPEASSAMDEGRYDVSLVEGSVTTADDVERIHHVRAVSELVVSIGACATAGGIQALRNTADVDSFIGIVYPTPEYISALATSTPISDHVAVDLELRGCPIDKHQLLAVLAALLHGGRARLPAESVCTQCKQRGNVCVLVASGAPCLGPATHAGCGAICPAYARGCYGCFGPAEDPNPPALSSVLVHAGVTERDVVRLLRTYNAGACAFAAESARMEERAR